MEAGCAEINALGRTCYWWTCSRLNCLSTPSKVPYFHKSSSEQGVYRPRHVSCIIHFKLLSWMVGEGGWGRFKHFRRGFLVHSQGASASGECRPYRAQRNRLISVLQMIDKDSFSEESNVYHQWRFPWSEMLTNCLWNNFKVETGQTGATGE